MHKIGGWHGLLRTYLLSFVPELNLEKRYERWNEGVCRQ